MTYAEASGDYTMRAAATGLASTLVGAASLTVDQWLSVAFLVVGVWSTALGTAKWIDERRRRRGGG